MKLNILGQEYELLTLSEEEFPKLKTAGASGLAELYDKKLIINKNNTIPDENTYDNLDEYINKVKRHEIIHAYFHEAGLSDYCHDEQLVDWLALQIPKIIETINQATEKKVIR